MRPVSRRTDEVLRFSHGNLRNPATVGIPCRNIHQAAIADASSVTQGSN
jgi:hypothetical protein